MDCAPLTWLLWIVDSKIMKNRVAILGNGSWATALAKVLLINQPTINWFIRRQEAIDEFVAQGKNPKYLSNIRFDTDRIHFSADINEVITNSDILVLAIPSPYVKQSLNKVKRSYDRN